MKFAVLTSYDSSFESLCSYTNPIKEEYCLRHGYDFIARKIDSDVHPTWVRFHLLHDLFEVYDWIMWMDADAFITNPEIKLESLVGPNDDLIISLDIHGLNTGVFLTRNSEWSKGFFRKFLEVEAQYPGYGGDQIAMNRTLFVDRWDDTGTVRYPKQKTLNSYLYEFYGQKFEDGQYSHGDFVLHLPGLTNQKRIEVIEGYRMSQRTVAKSPHNLYTNT